MVELGAWSMLLLVLAVQALALAAALASVQTNRLANRYLAGMLAVVAGLLTPFVLGYAGAYDAWPWLTFAPFAVPLALGPLLYGHVRALTRGCGLGWVHWLPPGAQFAYQTAMFPLPTATKWRFDAEVQEPFLGPIVALAVLASMAGYAAAAWREHGRYLTWLRERRRDPAPAARLRPPVAALVLLVVARAAYDLWDRFVQPTDYFDLFAYYVLLGTSAAWLGVEGWRGARLAVPPMAAVPPRDWRAQGEAWLAELRRSGRWRDPRLSLASLALMLGTNRSHLSRALNEAADGFASAINAIRAEAVAARIEAGDAADLLTIALEEGFGSKASFNRAFRDRFGVAPSAYRMRRDALRKSSSMAAI
jgi:AraC-like DNA-binding protein